jgi:ribosomal protein S13
MKFSLDETGYKNCPKQYRVTRRIQQLPVDAILMFKRYLSNVTVDNSINVIGNDTIKRLTEYQCY